MMLFSGVFSLCIRFKNVWIHQSLNVLPALSVEGVSKTQVQATPAVHDCGLVHTHAAKFRSAALSSIFLCPSFTDLLLDHVMEMNTARCLNLISCLCRSTSVFTGLTEHICFFFLQLFRRVAAALPGMDTTQDKSREDSILCVHVGVPLWHDRKWSGLFSHVARHFQE